MTADNPSPAMTSLLALAERCRGNATSIGAYFTEGRRVAVQCERPPKWRVFVNPPRDGADGTALLCDLCNRFDYQGFRREEIPDPAACLLAKALEEKEDG